MVLEIRCRTLVSGSHPLVPRSNQWWVETSGHGCLLFVYGVSPSLDSLSGTSYFEQRHLSDHE